MIEADYHDSLDEELELELDENHFEQFRGVRPPTGVRRSSAPPISRSCFGFRASWSSYRIGSNTKSSRWSSSSKDAIPPASVA
jgi:hypothetical protein